MATDISTLDTRISNLLTTLPDLIGTSAPLNSRQVEHLPQLGNSVVVGIQTTLPNGPLPEKSSEDSTHQRLRQTNLLRIPSLEPNNAKNMSQDFGYLRASKLAEKPSSHSPKSSNNFWTSNNTTSFHSPVPFKFGDSGDTRFSPAVSDQAVVPETFSTSPQPPGTKASVKAQVESLFLKLIRVTALPDILNTFSTLCKVANCNPGSSRSKTWKHIQGLLVTEDLGKTLWKRLEQKVIRKVYLKQRICYMKNVLVIGSGPCGLRMAIECALLGARVVVVEKRLDFNRTNVVYLWNFVIEDLVDLGAKYFNDSFCTGSNNVFPIRQLQIVLTKIALLLGVTVITGCDFVDLNYPCDRFQSYTCFTHLSKDSSCSTPSSFKLQSYQFRTLVCASGQTIAVDDLFTEKKLGKKSSHAGLGITANFIKSSSRNGNRFDLLESPKKRNGFETSRKRTDESPRPHLKRSKTQANSLPRSSPRRSMKESKSSSRLDDSPERYKHDWKDAIDRGFFHQTVMHYDLDKYYFIMTADPHILKHVGAIKSFDKHQGCSSLASSNIDEERLADYAKDAANYSSHGKYYPLEYAKNSHRGPDVSLFHCSPHVTADHAAKLIDRHGQFLLVLLVGDSLIHPFWKTGSGIAKGFMSVFDSAWVLRLWAVNVDKPLLILALRESMYLYLKDLASTAIKTYDRDFCIDPLTRYRSKFTDVGVDKVRHLLDDDRDVNTCQGSSNVASTRKTNFKSKKGSMSERASSKKQEFSIFSLLDKFKSL